MKITHIKSIKRRGGLTELRHEIRKDVKIGLILASCIVPFPFLGLFGAPIWAWASYFGWIALVIYAQKPARSYKKGRKFEYFEIGEEEDVHDRAG